MIYHTNCLKSVGPQAVQFFWCTQVQVYQVKYSSELLHTTLDGWTKCLYWLRMSYLTETTWTISNNCCSILDSSLWHVTRFLGKSKSPITATVTDTIKVMWYWKFGICKRYEVTYVMQPRWVKCNIKFLYSGI